MSDSLQQYTLQYRQTAPPDGQAISDDTGWNLSSTPAANATSASDSTAPPVWYRLKQTTVNGVVVPFTIPSLSAVAAGTTLSLRQIKTTQYPDAADCRLIATVPGGYIAVGTLSGTTIQFGNGIVTGTTQNSAIWVMRYDNNNNPVWSAPKLVPSGYSATLPLALASDSSGNVYVGGYFYTSLIFDGVTIPAISTQSDAYIFKVNADGTLGWHKTYGTYDKAARIEGLAINAFNGRLLATGRFSGIMDFGLGNKTSNGGNDIVVLQLDASDGHTLKSDNFGGTANDEGVDICCNPSGDYFVAGLFFSPSVDFGGTTKTLIGFVDLFVAKYNAAGTLQWVNNWGGASASVFPKFIRWFNGAVVVNGRFGGTINLGGANLVENQNGAITFTVKYSDNTTSVGHVWSRQDGNDTQAAPQDSYGLIIDNAGSVYATTVLRGGAYSFGNGLPFLEGTPGYANNATVVKFDGSTGLALWADRFKGILGNSQAWGVCVLDSGKLAMAGAFTYGIDFGNNVGQVQAGFPSFFNDGFIVQCSP